MFKAFLKLIGLLKPRDSLYLYVERVDGELCIGNKDDFKNSNPKPLKFDLITNQIYIEK